MTPWYAASRKERLPDPERLDPSLPRPPRVFFQEWPDPLIPGIRWVSELVEFAGGEDVCVESRAARCPWPHLRTGGGRAPRLARRRHPRRRASRAARDCGYQADDG